MPGPRRSQSRERLERFSIDQFSEDELAQFPLDAHNAKMQLDLPGYKYYKLKMEHLPPLIARVVTVYQTSGQFLQGHKMSRQFDCFRYALF